MEKNVKLTPFKLCVLQNFPYIEEDFDALTNYGLMCKIVEYLNKVIEQENITGENVNVLLNWFNNLDVQDEVDKKLDEMAQSGKLQEIMAEYLNAKAIFAFDSVEDMKNSTNLLDGTYVETYGFYANGDGGSSKYLIREVDNDDVIDEVTIIALNDERLVAEIIPENNTINVLQLGCKNDGVTENQNINIQKGIDYLDRTLKGGTIYIPNGKYIINYVDYNRESTGTIYGIVGIRLHSNISLIGESKNAILQLQSTQFGTGAFYRLIGSDMDNKAVENIVIKNLTLDGSYSTHLAGNVNENNIRLDVKGNILIENINSLNCRGNGILVTGNVVAPNIKIINNYVDTVATIGIQCSHFTGLVISNNIVKNCTNNGIDIYGDSGTGIDSYNFTISNNIVDNALVGIFPETVEKGTVTSNTILNCTDGVHINSIHGQSNNINVTNNTLLSCQVGVNCTGPQYDITINNNNISNYTNCAFNFLTTSKQIVSNNILNHSNANAYIIKTSGEYARYVKVFDNIISTYTTPPTNLISKGATSENGCIWDIKFTNAEKNMSVQQRQGGQTYCPVNAPTYPTEYSGTLRLVAVSGANIEVCEYPIAFINGVLSRGDKKVIYSTGNTEITACNPYANIRFLVYTATAGSVKYQFDIKTITY